MGLTIGVDVGGTKILAGVVDATGRIVASERIGTPNTTPAAMVEAIATLVRRLRAEHVIEAVGIGAAGFVARDRRTVLFAPNLVWRDEPLAERVATAVQLPVVVENDANCHAWGEYRFGAGRGHHHVAVVAIGTGVGGGLIIDGRLYRGSGGVAGEFGHLVVVPDGLPCGCGRRGCWEQYCSGLALVRNAAQMLREEPARLPWLRSQIGDNADEITGPLVTSAADAGDPGAIACFDVIGRWIGVGLAIIATSLDPACIVVGGGVADASEFVLGPARAALEKELGSSRPFVNASIVPAELGSSAGVVGAADLARLREGDEHGADPTPGAAG